jgi:RNA polymerase sigma-70 factor, ECF subfamily
MWCRSVPEVDVFDAHRGYLFGVAYRMLSSAADAEDIVQEAYLRWSAQPRDDIREPRGFLTTIVVRLCLDELRSARARRETYVGPWLPEPLVESGDDPADSAELADTLSLAFLVVLEELKPTERAAFLLHDVFDYDYGEIARMLDRQEPACRQLVSRARNRVGDRRHRFDADRAQGRELAERFLVACTTGNVQGLMSILAEDVIVWTDGGGLARAARRPIHGSDKSSRFLAAVSQTVSPNADVRHAAVNGQPGLVIAEGGSITTAIALDIVDARIVGVRVVSNPEKLRGARLA